MHGYCYIGSVHDYSQMCSNNGTGPRTLFTECKQDWPSKYSGELSINACGTSGDRILWHFIQPCVFFFVTQKFTSKRTFVFCSIYFVLSKCNSYSVDVKRACGFLSALERNHKGCITSDANCNFTNGGLLIR